MFICILRTSNKCVFYAYRMYVICDYYKCIYIKLIQIFIGKQSTCSRVPSIPQMKAPWHRGACPDTLLGSRMGNKCLNTPCDG